MYPKYVLLISIVSLLSVTFLYTCETKPASEKIKSERSWYIAKLKPEILGLKANSLDTIITVSNEDKILFFTEENAGYLENARVFGLTKDKVVMIDTLYFKFRFSKADLISYVSDPQNELAITSIHYGFGKIENLLERLINNDQKAFNEFIKLDHIVDAAAVDVYHNVFWITLNIISDSQLINFLKNIKKEEVGHFKTMVFDTEYTYPLTEPKLYLELFYPETLKFLQEN